MPDLGKYAGEVLAAYGISLFILAGLVMLSWRQSRKARLLLDDVESKRNG